MRLSLRPQPKKEQNSHEQINEHEQNHELKFLDLIDESYFVDVHHDISVPVGYGLGCSAAVALSLSLALNEALGTNLSRTEIGQIAHNAEISCKTGLGDVLAAFHG